MLLRSSHAKEKEFGSLEIETKVTVFSVFLLSRWRKRSPVPVYVLSL